MGIKSNRGFLDARQVKWGGHQAHFKSQGVNRLTHKDVGWIKIPSGEGNEDSFAHRSFVMQRAKTVFVESGFQPPGQIPH